jgi:hypothetical protein
VTVVPPTGSVTAPTFTVGSPTPTIAPNEVRPPEGWLVAGAQRAIGAYGRYNWYRPDIDTGAQLDLVPYVILPSSALRVPNGTAMSVETLQGTPYPVTGATVEIFTYSDNIAIPQDQQGNIVGENYAFVEQQPPVQEGRAGADLQFTPNVAPGNYIVRVDTQWQAPPEIAANLESPLHVEYVFLLEVQ